MSYHIRERLRGGGSGLIVRLLLEIIVIKLLVVIHCFLLPYTELYSVTQSACVARSTIKADWVEHSPWNDHQLTENHKLWLSLTHFGTDNIFMQEIKTLYTRFNDFSHFVIKSVMISIVQNVTPHYLLIGFHTDDFTQHPGGKLFWITRSNNIEQRFGGRGKGGGDFSSWYTHTCHR